jgi:proliferating cell nuclear antigen PCNA
MKDGYIFEVMTEHVPVFRNLFETLSDVLDETTITFIKPDKPIDNSKNEDSDCEDTIAENNKNGKREEGGIRILEENKDKTVIIYVRLKATKENFYKFDCNYDKYSIGLDPTTMYTYLKNIDKEGIMSLYISEVNKHVLYLEVSNSEKQSNSTYDLKLMDLNQISQEIPKPSFDIIVEMRTDEFNTICKDLSQFSKYIAIECTENKIDFKCKGTAGNITRSFNNAGSLKEGSVNIIINNDDTDDKKKSPKIVREIFDLSNIVMFNKCKSMSNTVRILLKNKFLMFIRYEVAAFGSMLVGFVPVNRELLNKNMNYDEKYDKYYSDALTNIKMKK